MSSLLEQTFLQVNIGLLVITTDGTITLCNHYMEDQTSETDLVGRNIFDVYPELPQKWLQRRIESICQLKNSSYINWEQRASLFNFRSSRPITGTQNKMIQNCSLLPILDDENQVSHICITVNDTTATAISQMQLKKTSLRLNEEKKAQQRLIEKLEETKNQLLQSEKMASIGQLAAGVAHEINNPVGFIKSNFNTLKEYAGELNGALDKYNDIIKAMGDVDIEQRIDSINNEHDIEYVTEDISTLLAESFDGISRIEDIVKSLKHFSRADTKEWEEADINEGIENTLKVVAHELKYIAEVEKDLNDLPLVQCLPMQINQVLMNLLVNAGHAIDPERNDGKVLIQTLQKNQQIVIRIQDNGSGIEEKHLVKIFDPFFTTKPIGKGTGLGLSLSYNIIQEHNGEIIVNSTPGEGTCFTITLPISQREAQNV